MQTKEWNDLKMKLKSYKEYKDSGVPWLGMVPGHWSIVKAKRLFKKVSRPINPEDEIVTCFRDGIVTLRKNRRTRGFTEALKEIGYQGILKGDLVIHQMDAFAGAIGVSDSNGKGTPVYSVCIPVNKNINPRFYAYIVREMARSEYILSLAKGIRERSTDFRFETFASQFLPTPCGEEQTQIALYLDYKTSQINRFIRAKKRIIELLKEQKQTIINDAVTGKIDVRTGKPYAKYKESGVEWLGKVPEGWDVQPIKRISLLNPSKREISNLSRPESLVAFLPMEKVSVDGTIDCSLKIMNKDSTTSFTYFRKNDVLVAKITPCFENGKGAFLNQLDTEYGFGSTEFITIRPQNLLEGSYLRCVLSSGWFLKIAEKYMTGSAGQKRISPCFIGNFKILLPEINQQKLMLQNLNSKIRKFDLTISRTEREISLIQEYRTRLIADVVTGKLDVRGIEVPDEYNEEINEHCSDEMAEDNLEETIVEETTGV